MGTCYCNEVAAYGNPERVAELAAWLESGRDAEAISADGTRVEFVTWTNSAPGASLYRETRKVFPDVRLVWRYHCDEEEVAGYLTE